MFICMIFAEVECYFEFHLHAKITKSSNVKNIYIVMSSLCSLTTQRFSFLAHFRTNSKEKTEQKKYWIDVCISNRQ